MHSLTTHSHSAHSHSAAITAHRLRVFSYCLAAALLLGQIIAGSASANAEHLSSNPQTSKSAAHPAILASATSQTTMPEPTIPSTISPTRPAGAQPLTPGRRPVTPATGGLAPLAQTASLSLQGDGYTLPLPAGWRLMPAHEVEIRAMRFSTLFPTSPDGQGPAQGAISLDDSGHPLAECIVLPFSRVAVGLDDTTLGERIRQSSNLFEGMRDDLATAITRGGATVTSQHTLIDGIHIEAVLPSATPSRHILVEFRFGVSRMWMLWLEWPSGVALSSPDPQTIIDAFTIEQNERLAGKRWKGPSARDLLIVLGMVGFAYFARRQRKSALAKEAPLRKKRR